jgi:hypothetical protein
MSLLCRSCSRKDGTTGRTNYQHEVDPATAAPYSGIFCAFTKSALRFHMLPKFYVAPKSTRRSGPMPTRVLQLLKKTLRFASRS